MLPKYEEGDTWEDMAHKAQENLTNDEVVSLGGYGGYIIFGFDHMVENHAGKMDFHILGNASYSNTSNPDASRKGGSCESGVVMVSYDANGNGLPDDEWYELAGSEYGSTTIGLMKTRSVLLATRSSTTPPTYAGPIIRDNKATSAATPSIISPITRNGSMKTRWSLKAPVLPTTMSMRAAKALTMYSMPILGVMLITIPIRTTSQK
jgi:hypothetical protein